jgi:ATP-dependent Clp protease ATP-binding subunit ClpA
MFSSSVTKSISAAFEQALKCHYAQVGLELWVRMLLENEEFLMILRGFRTNVSRLKDELDTRLAQGEMIPESTSSSRSHCGPRSTLAFQVFMRQLAIHNGKLKRAEIAMTDVFCALCSLREAQELGFVELLNRFAMTEEAWEKHNKSGL